MRTAAKIILLQKVMLHYGEKNLFWSLIIFGYLSFFKPPQPSSAVYVAPPFTGNLILVVFRLFCLMRQKLCWGFFAFLAEQDW